MNPAHIAFAAAVALTFTLTACSKPDAPPKTGGAQATTQAVAPSQRYETVAAQGKGFSVGAMMSANPVYVLFDPQCPHCGHLWEASLPLQDKVRFVWIPVSIMNSKSIRQGAALLSAGNPVEAMSAHEKSVIAGAGGMAAPSSVPPEMESAIQKNTALFTSLGGESVPYVLAKNVTTGAVVTNTGSLTTPELAKFLGITAP